MAKVRAELMPGRKITAESLAEMFERLTGRRPAPEELERGRLILERSEESEESPEGKTPPSSP